LWILTKFEQYTVEQCHKLARDDVSKSMYLYDVEASHFNNRVVNQETFVGVRLEYVESAIRRILDVDSKLRDDERLRACLKAREWCHEMIKEIRE